MLVRSLGQQALTRARALPCCRSRFPVGKLNFPLADYTTGPGAINLGKVDALLLAAPEESEEAEEESEGEEESVEEEAAPPAPERAAAPRTRKLTRSAARNAAPVARCRGPAPAAGAKRLPATPPGTEPAAKRQAPLPPPSPPQEQAQAQAQRQRQQPQVQQQQRPARQSQANFWQLFRASLQGGSSQESPGSAVASESEAEEAQQPGAAARDGIQATEEVEEAQEADGQEEVAGPAGAADAGAQPAGGGEELPPEFATELVGRLADAIARTDSGGVCDVLLALQDCYETSQGQYPQVLGPLQVRSCYQF